MTTTPTAAARVSGTIKALEWEARTDILGLHNAKGCDGYWYNVQQVADGVFVYEGHPADMPDHVGSKHPSLIVAKAAAQADYEARILAAIQPDPKPKPVATTCANIARVATPSSAGMPTALRYVPTITTDGATTPYSAGTVSVEAAALEGAVNWLDALISLIEDTSCEPDDEERFEDVMMGARLWLKNGRATLRDLAGDQS